VSTGSSTGYPRSKWALDKLIAAALLLFLAPVFLVVVVLVGVDMAFRPVDRGPWLYRERRISRGSDFDLLKFRTLRRDVIGRMASEAHARLHEGDDRNLTWAGRVLLKPWYLDELPQLWNVLRGDMSLVGPRPWPPSMVAEQVAKGYTYRNEVVAGWTGPAQVQKGVTESAGYTELDLEYVHACRDLRGVELIRRDLGLLGSSLRTVLRGEGLNY
jgi:lipopolysaccharide/colanic/teichoic acid biosynthesis glycosyltransferase